MFIVLIIFFIYLYILLPFPTYYQLNINSYSPVHAYIYINKLKFYFQCFLVSQGEAQNNYICQFWQRFNFFLFPRENFIDLSILMAKNIYVFVCPSVCVCVFVCVCIYACACACVYAFANIVFCDFRFCYQRKNLIFMGICASINRSIYICILHGWGSCVPSLSQISWRW